jgi:L-iditol 2-dehydrogenase
VTLRGPCDVAVVTRPTRATSPGDALVRMVASGVCGTDVSIYEGGIPVERGRVLGHEGAGTVEAAPPGSALEHGSPVLVDPTIACGRCRPCREALPNLCAVGGLLGRDFDGVFADLVAVPATNLHPLPGGVPLDLAPVVQVLATVVRAQDAVAAPLTGVAAVVGLGFTGQLHAQLLLRRGLRVLGVGRSPGKLRLAERLGCTWTTTPDEAAATLAAVAPDGAAVVVEAAGTMPALRQAIELARPGATVVLYGTYTETRAELPFYALYFKELALVATRASRPRDMAAAISLVAARAVELEPLVSDRLGLDEAAEALARSRDGALKVVMSHT